jgi:hypothetical protein
LLPSNFEDEWEEPHIVKTALGPANTDHPRVLSADPLSPVVAALLEIAATHKAADIDRRNLPDESILRNAVTGEEIRAWHRHTMSLADRLDLSADDCLAVKQLADRMKAAHDWPALFIRPNKLPTNSADRRELRLTIALWALETLRRAGDDVENRKAPSDAFWRAWRIQLYELFDGLPDEERPTFSDKALDNRFQRFEKERVIPEARSRLMVWLLDAAIPLAGRRTAELAETHPTQ